MRDLDNYSDCVPHRVFLTNFCDIGNQMQRFVEIRIKELHSWVKDAYEAFSMDEYRISEQKYAQNKKRIISLVEEVERLRLDQKKVPKTVISKLELVSLKVSLPTQEYLNIKA